MSQRDFFFFFFFFNNFWICKRSQVLECIADVMTHFLRLSEPTTIAQNAPNHSAHSVHMLPIKPFGKLQFVHEAATNCSPSPDIRPLTSEITFRYASEGIQKTLTIKNSLAYLWSVYLPFAQIIFDPKKSSSPRRNPTSEANLQSLRHQTMYLRDLPPQRFLKKSVWRHQDLHRVVKDQSRAALTQIRATFYVRLIMLSLSGNL
jgi:hypothetical protein